MFVITPEASEICQTTDVGVESSGHDHNILTLDVQEHALLMTPDPAERFAVEAAQVAEPHPADRQRRLAVAAAHLEASVLALETRTHPHHSVLAPAAIMRPGEPPSPSVLPGYLQKASCPT